jgi:SAM-dependent methyltransferase
MKSRLPQRKNGGTDLNSPARIREIREIIDRKPSLRHFYREIYLRYADCLKRCPAKGLSLELGSGGGFAGECVPELIASDILPYEGMDMVADGTMLPFHDGSLRFVCMTNVFHHIPDVGLLFREIQRCLVPGGRILIVDQHPGLISGPLLKYLHHEPFDNSAAEWRFVTTGPLSGANGALPWLVFVRDRERFHRLFPRLEIVGYSPHTPLGYWLAGGLKRWNLIPRRAIGIVERLDRLLLRCSSGFGSFADIEIVKT